MPTEIEGFSHVEYLIVFNAIIYGYVVAEYFVGWGSLIRNRTTYKIYWPHILWTLFAFLMLIQNWWGNWPRTGVINENIGYFCYSLVPIFIFHLVSVILFPSSRIRDVDLKVFFYNNTRWLFALLSVYFTTTILSSFIYHDLGNVAFQNMIRALGVLLSIGAAYYNKSVVAHLIFLVIAYISLLSFFAALL